jgi:sigma-B regulation protein RsbU (phosphoserine phosphatase)
MNIRTRILVQTLSASLVFTIILAAVFFFSVAGIRNTVLANSNILGDSAAEVGAYALEVQLTEKIDRIAQDIALILDERFNRIENHTRMTADITGSIYTTRQGWSLKPLPRIIPGEIPPPEPYLYIVPGANFADIRAEAELVGNINEMLRQTTVVGGIATSVVGGETGYIIAMDASPWPLMDFDPRNFNWYIGAKKAESLFWTDVYKDHRGRGPVIACSVPFYEQTGRGRILRGVAQSTVMLSDLSQIIDSTGVGRSGQLFLLNRSGIKIYSSSGAEISLGDGGTVNGENFLDSSLPSLYSLGLSMTLGAAGMTELEMDGVPVYVAYAPVQTLGWSLGVAVPAQEISTSALLIENQIWKITDDTKAGMDRYILLLAGLIAFLLVVMLFGIGIFSVRFTRAITGPILALNEGVHEVAAGNLEREVTVKTGDEIEQLAVSFNMMTSQLRKHIDEIARVSAERQRINTELDIATQIQMSMLPNVFPPFSGRKNEFDLYAEVHPAKEVGGDFYDFFFVDDDHFAVIVADVSGKGIPAALFMAISKTIIKNHVQSGEDPAHAMEIVNKQLCDNNIADMFVTAWLCIMEISSGRLVYINAGHNPPLLRHGDQDFIFLVSPPDLVLAGMDDTVYHCNEMQIEGGDMLFLYTDGIVEAENSSGGFYGKERLRVFLNANASQPLREMLPSLRSDIAAFANGAEQSDDITMLAICVCVGKRIQGCGRVCRYSSVADCNGNQGCRTRSISLKAEIGSLEQLMAFIGSDLDAGACPGHIREQIELAAEEIFVNIINYAYVENESGGSGEADVACTLEPAAEGAKITLVFSDRGRPFNPLEYPEPDINLPLEKREKGGLGLLIVKKTMDKITYSREGGVNRLEFGKSWQKEGT